MEARVYRPNRFEQIEAGHNPTRWYHAPASRPEPDGPLSPGFATADDAARDFAERLQKAERSAARGPCRMGTIAPGFAREVQSYDGSY